MVSSIWWRIGWIRTLNLWFGLTALSKISLVRRLNTSSRLRRNSNQSQLQMVSTSLCRCHQMLTVQLSKPISALWSMYRTRTAWYGRLSSSQAEKNTWCELHSASHQWRLKSAKSTLESLSSSNLKFLTSPSVVFKSATSRLWRRVATKPCPGFATSPRTEITRFACSDY